MTDEDLTKTVTVKRSAKKKSGYTVAEQEGYYYMAETPAKARVTPGDKVVGINGIKAEEFLDENDANDLIESIRIVVVPKDNFEEYDERHAGERNETQEDVGQDEDKNEKATRGRGAGNEPGIFHCNHCDHDNEDLSEDEDGDLVCEDCGHVLDAPATGDNKVVHTCNQCGHENVNLEKDEDGDFVCQECGYVIEPPSDNQVVHTCTNCDHKNVNLEKDEDGDLVCQECGTVIEPTANDSITHACIHCGHENTNLERDEDGDLVCQECGHVIPEENAGKDGESPNRQISYECPDCGHNTINPEPDEEGDRICEECGCILPEKQFCNCQSCGHENIDPQPDEEGNYYCGQCGELMDEEEVNREKTGAEKLNDMRDKADSGPASDGQEFDEDGNPITNPEGKRLTPADMFNPGDVITVTVGKSNPKQDPGLKIFERNGKYYVRKVPSGGLFSKTPVIAGDKVLELNGKDHHEFKHVNELKQILRDEEKITIVVLRKDPDASESSASSVDYDELNPITPNGDITDNDSDIDEKDENTVGYDGDDCGCTWCPDCH